MKLVFGDPESIKRKEQALKTRKYGAFGLKKISYMHQAFGGNNILDESRSQADYCHQRGEG